MKRLAAVIAPAVASSVLLASCLYEGVTGQPPVVLGVDHLLFAVTIISWAWTISVQNRNIGRKLDSSAAATNARVDAGVVTVCNSLNEFGYQVDTDARVDTMARIADGTASAPPARPRLR